MKGGLSVDFLWLSGLPPHYLWLFISGGKSSGSGTQETAVRSSNIQRQRWWENNRNEDSKCLKPLHHPPLRTKKNNVTAAEYVITWLDGFKYMVWSTMNFIQPLPPSPPFIPFFPPSFIVSLLFILPRLCRHNICSLWLKPDWKLPL